MAQDVYPPMPEQAVALGGQAFVGPSQPIGVTGQYLWVQTGLGDDGTGITFWVEDGS